ncbi:MAG: hypothetical protein WCW14_03620 [Candidatus Paceibacterota bacterium]|jgi:hypothetical protein
MISVLEGQKRLIYKAAGFVYDQSVVNYSAGANEADNEVDENVFALLPRVLPN